MKSKNFNNDSKRISAELSSYYIAEATARAILDSKSFLIHTEKPFRLTSGLLAPFYINCRQILSHPQARGIIANGLANIIKPLNTNMVAGGVTAGVPYATMVADRLDLPLVYVRGEPKEHGTGAQIEGGRVVGQQIVLVEDLVTTGKSIINFSKILRDEGAIIDNVVVMFTRPTDDAVSKIENLGIRLSSLCDLKVLLRIALEDGVANKNQLKEVYSFLEDPRGWSLANDK
ncbi:MAG: orotate phosphoribosyltransferase [Alphaproteobacteria bacterium]|nr:orotate phosphoribosyltransferase [Alphaproteobacteria bacterium]|tara:strand:- start:68 stop:760 length:693 start_codon:yes stop_codon:yes gene_type:complete